MLLGGGVTLVFLHVTVTGTGLLFAALVAAVLGRDK